MHKVVLHCLDPGRVLRYRLVDEVWQYEALVDFSYPNERGIIIVHPAQEWIPVIELAFVKIPEPTPGPLDPPDTSKPRKHR